MFLVWIATYRSSLRELTGKITAKRSVRKRFHPNSAALTSLVVNLLDNPDPADLPPDDSVVFACRISADFVYTHLRIMSPLQREQYMFWMMQSEDLDMENNLFFFSVLDLWPLPAPRLAHSTSKSIVFPLDRGLAEDFLHGIDPANIPLWVTEPLCTVAIRIPAPYVELCLRRLCTSLAWSTVKREHRLFRAPACPDLLAPFVRPELPMVLGHFDDACAYEVAEELRQLASTIDPSTEDGRERLLTLHCLATLLQRTNDSSKHQRGGGQATCLTSVGASLVICWPLRC